MPAKTETKPIRPETVRKGDKWCPRCGEVKAHDLFARNRASKDGLFSICKECEKADRIKAKERKAAAAAEVAKGRHASAPGRRPRPDALLPHPEQHEGPAQVGAFGV